MAVDLLPNNTLYINNLNEKIKKDELKKALYHVFSQFGTIVDIVALKTLAMRGQAFVIFEDIAAASRALREMQNFSFYQKPMHVAYAKTKSDLVSKKDGTFVARPKRKTDKRGEDESDDEKDDKTSKIAKKKDGAGPSAIAPPAALAAASTGALPPLTPALADEFAVEPPNKLLFVSNLPIQAKEMALTALFGRYSGFKEVRLIEAKPGIAFVEYENEIYSGRAMDSLQHFQIDTGQFIKITFAKQ